MSRIALFGTDGIRGKANEELTAELALKVGQAAAVCLGRQTGSRVVLVGKDTRSSGDMLESAFSAGVASIGFSVHHAGIVPTPAVSHLTRSMKAAFGCMISASHNPAEDNGIKFFSRSGFKVSDVKEREMEDFIVNALQKPRLKHTGSILSDPRLAERYFQFLKSRGASALKGLRVVVDCAHGASSSFAKRLFYECGAAVESFMDTPTGYNINENCGSLHPEYIRKKVLKFKAHAGFAFDGDADRVIVVDEKGNILTGDHYMAVLAGYLKEKKQLKNNVVVATIMSNMGLELFLKEKRIQFFRTSVGDKFVAQELKKRKGAFGGEQAGHLIFMNENPSGDGLMSALKLCNVLVEKGKPLSELASKMALFPQVIFNAVVRNKEQWTDIPEINRCVADAEEKISRRGRILVRPSGTEPKLRVMLEGENEELIKRLGLQIKETIEKHLK